MVFDRRDEWTRYDRTDETLYSQKYVKVPCLTKGRNPLPSHALARVADLLKGLGESYLIVAKNEDWQRASQRARVNQLMAECDRVNRELAGLLKLHSDIIDEKPVVDEAEEERARLRDEKTILRFKESIGR